MSSANITNNNREIIKAQSTITGLIETLTSTNGKLNVNTTGAGTTGSTTIADGINNALLATVDSNLRLHVKISNTDDGSIVGKILLSNANNNATQNVDTTTSEAYVSGGIASGATDAGNPVKVGAVYKSSPPTLTSGQRTDLITDSTGNLKVTANNLGPGAGIGDIGSAYSTGSAIPARAFPTGASDGSGNLITLKAWAHGINTATGLPAAALLAELDDTSPTTVTENQAGALRLSTDRSLLTTPRSVTPTQTSVAASATTVSLLASNANRKGATLYNDSTAILYLKLGATASTTSYSVQMASNTYYEVPYGYIGAIDGIWALATGNARITEIV